MVGHHIVARPKWLARHGVNLITEPAQIYPQLDFFRAARWTGESALDLGGGGECLRPSGKIWSCRRTVNLFALSLEDGRFTPILYLNRNQAIDRVLDERGIERVNVF